MTLAGYDGYSGGWFGASWGARVCDPAGHRATPIGAPCMDCKRSIVYGDQGLLIPDAERRLYAMHVACFLGRTWTDLREPTPSITCPRCGRTSHHPQDVVNGYCGACHDWTAP